MPAACTRCCSAQYATAGQLRQASGLREEPLTTDLLTRAGPVAILCCMSQTEVAQNATYQSAERVLTLLKSFDDGRTELGVADIARALSVHKSTASRLAAALERTGFLTRVD